MNYISLINYFWDEVPYLPGYKSEYGCMFLAIVDSCNRNGWRTTSIEYDRLHGKVKVGKRMYYEAIKWLVAQSLVTYKPGRNEYAAAVFDLHEALKAEVQKCTSTTPQPTPLQHLYSTTADTSTAPIIDKQINNKTTKQQEAPAPPEVKPEKPKKIAVRPNVLLLESELQTLIKKHGQSFVDLCLDKLSAQKESTGKQYTSDYGAINSWVVDAITERNQRLGIKPAAKPQTFVANELT